MHFLSLLTLAVTASASAIPTAEKRQTCAAGNANNIAKAKAAFTAAKIVPDVIPQFNPTLELSVDYNGKAVNFGNTFNTIGKPSLVSTDLVEHSRLIALPETVSEPSFSITAEKGHDPKTTKYTLIMVDPDAPGPAAPILADFLHWIVSDVQPKCITTQVRKMVAMYMTPTPLSVAPHRYVFLIYRQPPNYVPPPSLNYLPANRAKFDLAGYVAKAKLQGPVGGNYYREGQAQNVCLLIPGWIHAAKGALGDFTYDSPRVFREWQERPDGRLESASAFDCASFQNRLTTGFSTATFPPLPPFPADRQNELAPAPERLLYDRRLLLLLILLLLLLLCNLDNSSRVQSGRATSSLPLYPTLFVSSARAQETTPRDQADMPDAILDDISHRRYNPLRGSWVLVSPHRTKRPWQGAQESAGKNELPDYDQSCYLCPGNKRAQGDANPKYDRTFVFVNDYSAVKEEQAEYEQPKEEGSLSARLLKAESTTGKCYVITFSPKHNLTLADMPAHDILPVIDTWTKIYIAHLDPQSPLLNKAVSASQTNGTVIESPKQQYRYMQIFENKGAAMGCSNPHPHGQVWTTTSLPEEPGMELQNMQQYRREHHDCHMLEDYAKLESEKGERTVFENESFWAGCPWWATWPFEIMVISKTHKRALVDFNDQERVQLAEVMSEITRRYDNLFETSFPYSMGLHQAPLTGTAEEIEASHFHIHFYPPLLRSATVRKFLVGYELMAEPQRDITSEQAAKRLRDCGGPLYRTVS
ncbi:hypothetical protein Q7P37_005543 [Cladosporium fusiforme]